jgi:hypothetical protein
VLKIRHIAKPLNLTSIVKDDNSMTNQPDFEIRSKGQISKEFIDRGILTFNEASIFVRQLAYGRNADKNNLASLFTDNCGTCSTKHALLKAHCYLKFEDQVIDLTKINSKPTEFLDDLIEEIEISPEQITDYKVNYHKKYLLNWLDKNEQISYSLNDIWKIREQCIQDLADKDGDHRSAQEILMIIGRTTKNEKNASH